MSKNRLPKFLVRHSFTLIEMMTVVVIVTILVALAVPNYLATREGAVDKEATSALRLVYAANKQYFAKSEFFYPVSGSNNNIATINGNLSIDLNANNWVYTLSGTGATYTAQATRNGRTWSVSQANPTPTCTGSCL